MKRDVEQKENTKNNVTHVIIVGILILLQLTWIIVTIYRLNARYTWLAEFMSLLSIFIGLSVFGRRMNSGIKMPWIILIMGFPILGLVLYLIFGTPNHTRGMRKRFTKVDDYLFSYLNNDKLVKEQVAFKHPSIAGVSQYLWDYCGFPAFNDTSVTYFSDTPEALEAMKESMSKASKFIFMEYHAIEDSTAFGELKEILFEKAAAGLDVRVFYDEVGSMGFLNSSFEKEMEAHGVKCRIFNPVAPFLNIFMNNRDHRKILVVDGKEGFTGGYNLADKYFHRKEAYGFWKDAGLMLQGNACKVLTALFLEMWNAANNKVSEDFDFEDFLTVDNPNFNADGFVQPYGDSPLDDEHTGENVYLDIINHADKYVYISTPYLILTDEMVRALTLAARKGVDVRIITPGIPDKKMVYRMTRSYYEPLARKGVRIYEYTPGFNHAKLMVSDDDIATVGTINMDYRSLYLHFENGCLLVGCSEIIKIKEDLLNMCSVSTEVTDKYLHYKNLPTRIGYVIMRLFAPLV